MAHLVNETVDKKLEVPRAWTVAYCVLIPKPGGEGQRPISISSTKWRGVTRALLATLAPWILQWLPDGVCGGVPTRTAEELLEVLQAELHEAHADKPVHAASIDLSNCFDRICPWLALEVADEMNMPGGITAMLRSFYSRLTVIYRNKDTTEAEGFQRTHGLLQGDSFSSLLIAMITSVWHEDIAANTGAIPCVFVDDRLIITNDVDTMRNAICITELLTATAASSGMWEKDRSRQPILNCLQASLTLWRKLTGCLSSAGISEWISTSRNRNRRLVVCVRNTALNVTEACCAGLR